MTLDDCRRLYAEEIRLLANITSPALIEAFARVPRENFVGAGPWKIASVDVGLGGTTYTDTRDADPEHLYHNVPVALDAARDLNNGQPAALAEWIDALNPLGGAPGLSPRLRRRLLHGDHAEVVGPDGRVTASESDAELAARAQANLAAHSNVSVHAGDGADFDPGECDAILINAGVTHPHPKWLASLRPGGSLMLPLTVTAGMGMGANLGEGVFAKTASFYLLLFQHLQPEARGATGEGDGIGSPVQVATVAVRPSRSRRQLPGAYQRSVLE